MSDSPLKNLKDPGDHFGVSPFSACWWQVFYAVAATAAAAWPEKPVRLIVPFAPGGSASSSARLTANKLSEVLGQQVIVENMGGANGSIGASAALRAPADGYTLSIRPQAS